MCVNIEAIMPTIQKFLFFYPLQCGTILIFVWTLLRTVFCIIFITTAILEILVGESFPLGAWLARKKPDTSNITILFYTQVAYLLCENVLLVFMVHFGIGIVRRNTYLLKHYLICRFFTWGIEVACLVALCFIHELLIGWYLGILLFVVLEFYSYVVVYSYYISLREAEKVSME